MADIPYMDEERHAEQARQNALAALYGNPDAPQQPVMDQEITPQQLRDETFSKSPFGALDRTLKAGTDWIKGKVAKRRAPFAGVEQDMPPGAGLPSPVELLPTMMLEGGRTANRWLYGTKDPTQLRDEDMLGPLGAGAMVGPFAAATRAGSHLGVFGGKLAKTADQEALKRAEEMAVAGKPREDIHKETGWFQGPDKQWRFEIDDSGMHTRSTAKEKAWNEYDNGRSGLAFDARREAQAASDDLIGKVKRGEMTQDEAEAAYQVVRRSKQEVIDEGRRLDKLGESLRDRGSLGQTVSHPPFFQAYPEADTIRANMRSDRLGDGTRGQLTAKEGAPPFVAELDVAGHMGSQERRSTALHEMQHAIQDKEGFGRGGSPSLFAGDVRSANQMIETVNKNLSDIVRQMDAAKASGDKAAAAELKERYDKLMSYKLTDLVPRAQVDPGEQYLKLAGETEARAVQARRDLTPEQRAARPPWMDYDVPEKDQIVRMGDAPFAASQPLDMSTEARMARAKEMGFDTDTTWYHGTKSAFDEFDPAKTGASDAGLAGKASYFTRDPEEAGNYALNETWGKSGGAPSVIPTHLAVNNPLMIKQGVLPDGRTLKDVHGGNPITDKGGDEIRQLAEAGGHDGVVFADRDGNARHTAVYEPSRIRSPFAAFNPADRDKSGLLLADQVRSGTPAIVAEGVRSAQELSKAPFQRKIDDLGYYSKLDEVLGSLRPTDTVTMDTLAKRGVKAAEIEARGLSPFMADGKGAKVGDLQGGAQPVQVRESQYGGPAPSNWEYLAKGQYGKSYGELSERARLDIRRQSEVDDYKDPKWKDYATDGDNPSYHEGVLHLPPTQGSLEQWKIKREDGHGRGTWASEAQARAAMQPGDTLSQADTITTNGGFRSGHWDEPNAIAHYRASMQPTEGGGKAYLIDELQSDWGQKLRDGGVRDEAKIGELRKKIEDSDAEMQALSAPGRDLLIKHEFVNDAASAVPNARPDQIMDWLGYAEKRIPEAQPLFKSLYEASERRRLADAELRTAEAATPGNPFVNTSEQWMTTALRRMMRNAAEQQADGIAITPGAVHNERFGLEKQIKELSYDPERQILTARPHDGRRGINEEGVTPEKLEQMVGKETAQKLLAQPLAKDFAGNPAHILGDQDLRMGGEGMKYAYDKILPKLLGKELSKLDPSIKYGQQELRPARSDRWPEEDMTDTPFASPFHHFPLTPKAREEIMKGLPLFNAPGGPEAVIEALRAQQQLQGPFAEE